MSDNENQTDAMPRNPRQRNETPDHNENQSTDKDNSTEIGNERIPKRQNQNMNMANIIYIDKSNGIHIGDNNFFNTNMQYHKGSKYPSQTIIKENSLIIALKNSTNAVSKADIELLSEHLTEQWVLCARKLKYSSGQIDAFQHKSPCNLRETVYQFLQDWIQNNGPLTATVGVLATNLWTTNQEEAVYLWAEQYKKINQ